VSLAGNGWELQNCRYGGLALFPLTDIIRWPLSRLNRNENRFTQWLEKIAGMELGVDFGQVSYGILLVLKKI
jgi:hypothetical protein